MKAISDSECPITTQSKTPIRNANYSTRESWNLPDRCPVDCSLVKLFECALVIRVVLTAVSYSLMRFWNNWREAHLSWQRHLSYLRC